MYSELDPQVQEGRKGDAQEHQTSIVNHQECSSNKVQFTSKWRIKQENHLRALGLKDRFLLPLLSTE